MDLEPRLNLTRKTAAACLLAALTLVAVPASAQKPDSKRTPPLPPLNQKVLDFARESLGKKVVNGECTDLAVEALRHAGARRFPRERSGDYIWGRSIDSTEK